MVKAIVDLLRTLLLDGRHILISKFKWMFILLFLWVYRVVAISADSGGYARALQVLCIMGLFYHAWRVNRRSLTYPFMKGSASVKWMMAYLTLGLISTLWSYNPQFSFFLAFEKMVIVMVVIAMFSIYDDLKKVEEFMVKSLLGIMLFEVVIWRIFKENSLFAHMLTTGSCGAILFAYCIGELFAKRVKDRSRDKMLRSVLIISLVVLIVSTSGGANASAALALGVALLVSGKMIWGGLLCIGGGTLYIQQEWMDVVINFMMPGKTQEQIETATGRENIWELIKFYGSQKPMWGWGYACIERVISDRNFPLTDAHNNYYGAWGGTGYIGLILLIGNHVSQIFISLKKHLKFGYSGLLCATCAAALNGYSFGFLSGKGCTIAVFYLAIMVATQRYSQIKVYDGKILK